MFCLLQFVGFQLLVQFLHFSDIGRVSTEKRFKSCREYRDRYYALITVEYSGSNPFVWSQSINSRKAIIFSGIAPVETHLTNGLLYPSLELVIRSRISRHGWNWILLGTSRAIDLCVCVLWKQKRLSNSRQDIIRLNHFSVETRPLMCRTHRMCRICNKIQYVSFLTVTQRNNSVALRWLILLSLRLPTRTPSIKPDRQQNTICQLSNLHTKEQ